MASLLSFWAAVGTDAAALSGQSARAEAAASIDDASSVKMGGASRAPPARQSPRRYLVATPTLSYAYSEHGLVREHAALDALQRLGPAVPLKRPEDVGAVEAERRVTPPAGVDGRRDRFYR